MEGASVAEQSIAPLKFEAPKQSFPLEKKDFDVKYSDEDKLFRFNFSTQDFRSEKPALSEDVFSDDFRKKNFSGCMDRDGKIYWTLSDKDFPTNLWSNLTESPPVSIFSHNPQIDRLFVSSVGPSESGAIIEFLLRSDWSQDMNMTVNSLVNTAVIRSGYNWNFMGRVSEWRGNYEGFIPDSELPKKEGYKRVPKEETIEKINELYKDVRSRDKFLIIRTMGVPVESDRLASASLLAPGHTEVFDARVGDFDKGAFIWEADSDDIPVAFSADAATAIFNANEAPPLRPDQSQMDLGDKKLYWQSVDKPMKVEELQKLVDSGATSERHYSEVIINPKSKGVKLVGIVNPYKVWGWSKIAYRQGVLEFNEVPDFSEESRATYRYRSITPKLSNN